jgi:hypothetical protein
MYYVGVSPYTEVNNNGILDRVVFNNTGRNHFRKQRVSNFPMW